MDMAVTKVGTVLAALFFSTVQASELVPATVVGVYDGDSITVEADLWPGLSWDGRVRIDGIDTPELRSSCDTEEAKEREKALAQEARAFVVDLVLNKTVFLAQVYDEDKYGRPLVTVIVDGENLADLLIDAGHAKPYDGGTKEGWCD